MGLKRKRRQVELSNEREEVSHLGGGDLAGERGAGGNGVEEKAWAEIGLFRARDRSRHEVLPEVSLKRIYESEALIN